MPWGAKSGFRPSSLRQVLSLSYGLLLLLGLTVLGFGIYGLVHHYMWRSGEIRMHGMMRSALQELEPGVTIRHGAPFVAPPRLQQGAQVLAKEIAEPISFVRIYDPQGHLLGQAGHPDIRLAMPASHRCFVHQGPRWPWQVGTFDLFGRHGVEAVVVVGVPWGPAQHLLAWLARYLLIMSAITLLLVWGVSVWLAARLSRPLELLDDTARQVASGNLKARSGVERGTAEVMRLARSFDVMVERLAQSVITEKRFVADASHELKTPLTSIGGMVEMLRRGALERPQDRELALTTLEREIDRMSRLVADLLALSRAEQQAPSPPEEVDLRLMLEEVAGYVGRRDPPTVDCPAGLTMLVRRHSLDRLLANLVENAAKYTPPGGEIRLQGRQVGSRVEIRVEDEGIGIPAEDLPHVFERFYRADRARARGTGGTGLGLSIVSALVGSLGGTVRLESQPGQGTRAILLLPRRAE